MTTTPRLRKPRLFVQVSSIDAEDYEPLQFVDEIGRWYFERGGEWDLWRYSMGRTELADLLRTHVAVPL